MTGRASRHAGVVEHATCLGCGCACDDIVVSVRDARIVGIANACPLGARWFGDGIVPTVVRTDGHATSLHEALDHAASLLTGARRPLVYIAPDISCEAQRAAIAIADLLHAAVDNITSPPSTAAAGVLAAQRRGRATATLGEIRNRADLVVFWGTDPTDNYPRFLSRYAPAPAGVFVPEGRQSRTVVAVDVGDARAPSDADLRVAIAPAQELDAVGVLRASIAARLLAREAGDLGAKLAPLIERFARARYIAVVYDAERSASGNGPTSPPGRAESLIALVQQLNDRTRAALVALRGGGNRNGAEAVMTWQTGFPMAVDFSRGAPRYVPADPAADRLRRGDVDAMLLVGELPPSHALDLARTQCVVVGPRASQLAPPAVVAIDTGIAGIHEGGTAYRMDDVPLPLRPSLSGPPDTETTVRALAARLRARSAGT